LSRGTLTVVGTGIEFAAHLSQEARAQIEHADKVLYLVADPATAAWIVQTNSDAQSLSPFYELAKDRAESYEAMAEEILVWVRKQLSVCAVFYGHPGIFTYPSHQAIEMARLEGYRARMLPAISAEDCLIADLGVDPARSGWQSYEATDFLIYPRAVDTSSALVLWQIGAIGTLDYRQNYDSKALELLVERLHSIYQSDHECVLYEAAVYKVYESRITRTTISGLLQAGISGVSTLYVPPKHDRIPDLGVVHALGGSIERQIYETASRPIATSRRAPPSARPEGFEPPT
jgi:uncharacterized protein YabN with tetrapyrrole methylase and pyrophosphatase domain